MKNLELIGKKLASQNMQTEQTQLTLRRQKISHEQTVQQIEEIDASFRNLNAILGDEKTAKLIVNNHLYPNTIISFGKYKRSIQTYHKYVQILLDYNEIIIQALRK